MQAKVHLIISDHRGTIDTACGREGHVARGYEPRPGDPGEYDTSVCDRIHATPHRDDVTCGQCKRRTKP